MVCYDDVKAENRSFLVVFPWVGVRYVEGRETDRLGVSQPFHGCYDVVSYDMGRMKCCVPRHKQLSWDLVWPGVSCAGHQR